MVDDGINTSNNNNNNNNPEGEDREINLYAVFFKYMVYWPWFVASVLACCIGMYVFLRYQTPVYNVTSSVLIKEDEKKGANAASGLAAIQDLGMLSMTSNFDNEVLHFLLQGQQLHHHRLKSMHNQVRQDKGLSTAPQAVPWLFL